MKIPIVGLRHEYDTNVQAAVPREEVFLEHRGYRGGFGMPTEPDSSQVYVVADIKYDKAQGYLYTLINKATKKIHQTNIIYRDSEMTMTNGYELGFCKMDVNSEDVYLMPKDEFRLLCARANALASINVADPKLGAYRDLPAGYKGTRYIPFGRKFTTADLLDKIKTYCKKQYPDYDIAVEMDGSEYVGKMNITILSGGQELRSQESVLRGYVRTRGVQPNDHNKSLLTPQGHNMLIDLTQYAMSYNVRYKDEDYPNYYVHVNVGSWENEYSVKPNYNEQLNTLSIQQICSLHRQILSQITDLEIAQSEWDNLLGRNPMNSMIGDLADLQYDGRMEKYSLELKSLEDKLEAVEHLLQYKQFIISVNTFNACYWEKTQLEGEYDLFQIQMQFEKAQPTQNKSEIKVCEDQLNEISNCLLNNRADQLQARQTLLEEAIQEEMHYLSDGNPSPDKELLDKWADRLNIDNRMPMSCRQTLKHVRIGQALADAANDFSQIDCLRTLMHEPANSTAVQNARRQVLAEAIREEIRFQQADFDRQKGEFWESPEDLYNPVLQNKWSAIKEKYNQEIVKWQEVLTVVEKQVKDSTKSKVKDCPSRILQSIEHKIHAKIDTNENKTTDIQNTKTI